MGKRRAERRHEDERKVGGGTATESRSRNRGCRRIAARRGYKAGRGPQNMRFCETKPFVMLANSPLRDVRAISYVDYTKMTNGFVFGEIGCGDGGKRTRRTASLQGWDTLDREG